MIILYWELLPARNKRARTHARLRPRLEARHRAGRLSLSLSLSLALSRSLSRSSRRARVTSEDEDSPSEFIKTIVNYGPE